MTRNYVEVRHLINNRLDVQGESEKNINAIVDILKDSDNLDLSIAIMDYVSCEIGEYEKMINNYTGEYESEVEYAENLLDDHGLDSWILPYINCEKLADDLFSELITIITPEGGGIYVFSM